MATLTVAGLFLLFLLLIVGAGSFLGDTGMVHAGERIGILDVEGTIDDPTELLQQIGEFREQEGVRAVVLRINSPGGSVGPSQELYEELKLLGQEKPLIVSMGSVAASGGYYLAIAGDRIFANPGTITGSIGVIMSFPNYQELMGKVGVRTEVVKSGRFKDIGSGSREFSEADRELLQTVIDDVHGQFVEAISKQRNLSLEQLKTFADGRIFTGRQAREIGLVDELGGFRVAVDYAAKQAGLENDPELIFPEPKRGNWLERYLDSALSRYLGVKLESKHVSGPQYLWSTP